MFGRIFYHLNTSILKNLIIIGSKTGLSILCLNICTCGSHEDGTFIILQTCYISYMKYTYNEWQMEWSNSGKGGGYNIVKHYTGMYMYIKIQSYLS